MDGWGIRLVVVTHHQLFRDSIRALLSTGKLRVIGESASVEDACSQIERLQPEVALFDIELPSRPGRDTVAKLRATAPCTELVALGSARSEELKQKLAEQGISYISMESRGGDLMTLLHRIASRRNQNPITGHRAIEGPADCLSQRERGVLELVAQSLTNAQIARRLEISEATVKRHLHNIFRKLRAVSRMDAVHKGGLLTMSPAVQKSTVRRPPPFVADARPKYRFT